ncbi:peptidoglycan DD-metalloendopeptidase family protein [Streptomyces sp. NPDC088725]|uniref:peptidoglycan DD-metalloendopeptidase family protein n=1 Tax=Streptomyces sp. NPDC088725 TaxID=3365873 RepID=UPI00380D570A
MNDQHAHAGYAAYDGDTSGHFDGDPLFGTFSGPYEADHNAQYEGTQWDAGAQHHGAGYDAYATPQYDMSGQWATVDAAGNAGYQPPADGTGQWDANAWNQANVADQANHANPLNQPDQPDQTNQSGQAHPLDANGQPLQYDATQFGYGTVNHPPTAQFDATQLQSAPYAYEATAQWAAPVFETGSYDTTAWQAAQDTILAEVVPEQFAPGYAPGAEYAQDGQYDADTAYGRQPEADAYQDPEGYQDPEPYRETDGYEAGYEAYEAASHDAGRDAGPESESEPGSEPASVHMAETTTTPVLSPPPSARPVRSSSGNGGNGNRGRRRTPAKRSALFTVAVPSACVMGVAGIAAASVGGMSGGEETQDDMKSLAAADPGSVKPVAANSKMDTQLRALTADARDFGNRANRTQERIDLKERQEAEKKKREEEAARKEAARPKFALPTDQHGLSAFFGQAGVNWMSVHTGIDFPLSYGTPVMAATDGTVRTQWNSAYGNMAIVTSPDGTETWYCHLSSTKIRSGSVKAGDTIAYSGNSGNSTGPHLHFEVRPGSGSAIDPLPWLRSHGLNPQ